MNDYIPSNRHGDYLMHYGIKGMKWKDHDYVEDFKDNWKSGYGMIKSSAKSNLKKLKKLVGKAKYKVVEKVDPKLRERDYVKNHKVHEEQDKREASEKMTQAKMMKNRMSLPTTRNVSNAASVAARAGVLDGRARLSEESKNNKERLSKLRTTNKYADKIVKDAERNVMKSEYGIGRYNAGANNVMREWHMRHDSKLGVQATAQNKLRKEISQTDSKRTGAANSAASKGLQAVANNRVASQQSSRNQAESSAAKQGTLAVNNNKIKEDLKKRKRK